MINIDGQFLSDECVLTSDNRAFLYGDGVFDTLRIVDGRILFFEDHYFRLMSSMRILRMEIPMNFTMEFIESQVLELAEKKSCKNSARARITICRKPGGYYLPTQKAISFVITAEPLPSKGFEILDEPYEVDIFKDFYVTAQLLSTIKSTNRLINITGSIYASENGLQNCLLMNEKKNIVSALNGNLFMLTNNKLVTPPISEGCLNGVMRRQVISMVRAMDDVEIVEEMISPFDLQKSDELFITNVIKGIVPITTYRKKKYSNSFSKKLVENLNNKIEKV